MFNQGNVLCRLLLVYGFFCGDSNFWPKMGSVWLAFFTLVSRLCVWTNLDVAVLKILQWLSFIDLC